MTVAIETQGGGAAIELAKVRSLIQDSFKLDLEARRLGVGAAALLTMLQTEEARIAALT